MWCSAVIEPWTWDSNLLLALNFDGGSLVDELMYGVSRTWIWVPLYAFVVWMVWRRAGWRGVAAFVVVAALTVFCVEMTCNFFKYNLSKFRPTHTEAIAADVHTVRGYVGGLYGTVSAHAANCMAFLVVAGGFLRRGWLWSVMGAWVVLVAYSRIYLGVHFPADIMFGLLTGTAWGLLALWVLGWCVRRFAISVDYSRSCRAKDCKQGQTR